MANMAILLEREIDGPKLVGEFNPQAINGIILRSHHTKEE